MRFPRKAMPKLLKSVAARPPWITMGDRAAFGSSSMTGEEKHGPGEDRHAAHCGARNGARDGEACHRGPSYVGEAQGNQKPTTAIMAEGKARWPKDSVLSPRTKNWKDTEDRSPTR